MVVLSSLCVSPLCLLGSLSLTEIVLAGSCLLGSKHASTHSYDMTSSISYFVGEIEGVEYIFKTTKEFERLLRDEAFLRHEKKGSYQVGYLKPSFESVTSASRCESSASLSHSQATQKVPRIDHVAISVSD